MADGFLAAVKAVSSFRPTKDQATFDTSSVSWAHALIGIVSMVAIQAALVLVPFAALPREALPMVLDLALVAGLALAIPFAVTAAAAAFLGKAEHLPAAFLFLAVFLTLMQVVLFVLSWIIDTRGGTTIGVLAVICFLGARNIVGLSTPVSILVGALVALCMFGMGFVLLALPTGQAMLAAG